MSLGGGSLVPDGVCTAQGTMSDCVSLVWLLNSSSLVTVLLTATFKCTGIPSPYRHCSYVMCASVFWFWCSGSAPSAHLQVEEVEPVGRVRPGVHWQGRARVDSVLDGRALAQGRPHDGPGGVGYDKEAPTRAEHPQCAEGLALAGRASGVYLRGRVYYFYYYYY